VITLFAGLPPPGRPVAEWDALTGAEDSRGRARARREEDRRALAVLGSQGVRLELLDAPYRATDVDPADVVPLLVPLTAQASAVWLPAAVGAHPDHVLTRTVGLLVAERAGVPVELYADLPYAFLDGWPADVLTADGGPDRAPADPLSSWPAEATVVQEVSAQLARRVGLTRRVHHLDRAALERKRAAVAAYDTQVPLLDQQCGGRLRRGEDLAVEVAWELRTVGAGP
jgi:hypothetical protein